ncbi:MAG: DUF3524 domain-containing protein [Ardenticatenaceae bacterium]|nr:DUF3524 domain-containing protein [Ardenticatenaceae bacterium]
MQIVLLEPYSTGSHAAWAAGYAAHSRHEVVRLELPGRFWKWRMHGGAVTLAREFRQHDLQPALLLATDMLDLTTFLALARPETATIPAALYFHENQLTFPPPPGTRRDLHYGFINYASALAAAALFFNSRFHREEFFDELPRLLKHFPDYNELDTIGRLRARAHVLEPGVALDRFDAHRPATPRKGPLTILWNHRWEYDKNPAEFFAALQRLAEENRPFEVIIAGESFRQKPEEFLTARAWLGSQVRHFGYAEDFATYARLLWEADLQVSTARHEFFGLATIEAIYCDCFPILPDRLVYPEYIPTETRDLVLYRGFEALVDRLRWAIQNPDAVRAFTLRPAVARFAWEQMAPHYDEVLSALVRATQ